MIDLHSHILWGVDDGAATLDDSLAMLRLAAASGTTDIVATPHANSMYPFYPAVLASRYQELAAHHSGLPRVHRGCDFHLLIDNVHDAIENPNKYTINNGRYLMVELPDIFHPPAIDQVLRQLFAKDMMPVITHPERNLILQRSPEILDRWVDSEGCLAQVTARSLTGHFGKTAKKLAWCFLRSGHVHFVASDGHDTHYRPPRLDEVQNLLSGELGEICAKCLTLDNPQAVIEDRFLEFEPITLPKRRRWFHMFRPIG